MRASPRRRSDDQPAIQRFIYGGAIMKTLDADAVMARVTPLDRQQAHEIQPFGHLVRMPIALSETACQESVENLNQVLADSITLRDLYKKHHWQVAGPTFMQLHLLFDKHATEQNELIDAVAERVQTLGGVSIAMAHDVIETTLIPRAPKGRESAPMQISRLLHAHEIVIKEARTMARQAADRGDDGTNDLLVSEIVRQNEQQAWFLAEHVIDVPLVRG
jgi:starvation-inducible DNA-binding protein